MSITSKIILSVLSVAAIIGSVVLWSLIEAGAVWAFYNKVLLGIFKIKWEPMPYWAILLGCGVLHLFMRWIKTFFCSFAPQKAE